MSVFSIRHAARIALVVLVAACASLAWVSVARAQHAGPGHGGAFHHHAHGVGRVGIGFGWGGYAAWPIDGGYVYYPYAPAYMLAYPYATDGSLPGTAPPLIYPRHGQTRAQTDADSNACSEWAGHQPEATTDAVVFRRGFAACMDGRGYSIR